MSLYVQMGSPLLGPEMYFIDASLFIGSEETR